RRELEQLQWVPGQNIELEFRWLARDAAEAAAWVRELVALHPDVLVVNSSPYVRAVRQAASGIPGVFVAIADPLGQGFGAGLARPGGDMTGFGVEEASMGAKWLEFLKEVAPDTASCACIFNPQTSPNSRVFIGPMLAVRQSMNVDAVAVPVSGEA